ncbi:hypothetical protein HY945_01660 [Candidatus Gottesmanbacteria bacterium]|nr:hypothetical protein [Candidatus Gottesmanbacteria bacterium]
MKRKLSRKKKTTKLFTIAFFFLIIFGIAAGTYLVQKNAALYTRSQASLRPLASSSCPTTSNQTYASLSQNRKLDFDPTTNPETNLYMRGWYEVNEGRELVSRRGDNYGLDPNMPPQISTLFTNHYPKIIKTYRINAWDYDNHHNIPGESATPAYAVHMLGLEAVPGEPLIGLKAGRTIDGTNVFHVQYATKNSILFIHSAGEDDGYPYFFLDICVDPNLLAAYERDNANGRNQLPVIATGQVFGYAASNEVKYVIRDTGSFMDTRYKEDWWEYGGFKPEFSTPPPQNTIIPTQIPTSLPIPTSIVIPTNPRLPTVTPIPTQSVIPTLRPTTAVPTQTIIYVLPSPTAIPLPTITLTPTPTKTLTQIITENPVFNLMKILSEKISLFLKVSLP